MRGGALPGRQFANKAPFSQAPKDDVVPSTQCSSNTRGGGHLSFLSLCLATFIFLCFVSRRKELQKHAERVFLICLLQLDIFIFFFLLARLTMEKNKRVGG